MEYAIQLLLPILGGLLLGNWLHETFGFSQLWTLLLAVLGLFGGIGLLYKRQMTGNRPLPTLRFPLSHEGKTLKQTRPESKTEEPQPPSAAIPHEDLLELYKKVDREPPTDHFALKDLLGDDEITDDPKR